MLVLTHPQAEVKPAYPLSHKKYMPRSVFMQALFLDGDGRVENRAVESFPWYARNIVGVVQSADD